MEKEKHQLKRAASIRVEPYLATYARKKFEIDPKTGGIKIPDTFDLYHCVWHSMRKWPRERWHVGVSRPVDAPEGNLLILLPNRREEGGVRKNPLYWSYISHRHARLINHELKRLFDWELHHWYFQQLERGMTKVDAVRSFIRYYGLSLDSEDALLKNLQRYKRTISIFLGLKKPKT